MAEPPGLYNDAVLSHSRVVARMSIVLTFVVISSIVIGAQGQPTPRTSSSVTVGPSRDVSLLEECSRAHVTQDGSPKAIQTCRDAVAAADEAGAAAFAPRAARSFLGDVYLFAKRWSDAVTAYQSALGLTKGSDVTDFDTGEILTKKGFAQQNLGDLVAADASLVSAVATLQASIASHADQRQKHEAALRTALVLHARVKELRGDDVAAQALRKRSDSLGEAK